MNTSVACLRISSALRAVGYYRHFTQTARMSVKIGDQLPSVELAENTPDNKINAKTEFGTGKHIIFGVPGAFTPGCSKTHLPGYVEDYEKLKKKGVTSVACVAVNDPFVMEAWGQSAGAAGKVRMLADTCATFTKALGVELDATNILGNVRCKRFALVVKDGKIEQFEVEPDGTGLTCSLSSSVSEKL